MCGIRKKELLLLILTHIYNNTQKTHRNEQIKIELKSSLRHINFENINNVLMLKFFVILKGYLASHEISRRN